MNRHALTAPRPRPARSRRRGLLAPVLLVAGVLLVALGLLAGLLTPAVSVPEFSAPAPAPRSAAALLGKPAATPADQPAARDVLDRLPVRAPLTVDYDRDAQFTVGGKGTDWIDVDGDGCRTDSEIRERDAIPGTGRLDRRGCAVDIMVASPYTGAVLPQKRTELDHVVPLKNALLSGAANLSQDDRVWIANDPLNLLVVDARENASKGDDPPGVGPNTYLPPQNECGYVARWVAVKDKHRLSVTPAERGAIVTVLDTCPGYRIPNPDGTR